jgi:manganese efflux pump family protein
LDVLLILLIAISLSMDAFSLSLCYGTVGLDEKKIKLLSLIVGAYHFIMPLLGMTFGHLLGRFIAVDIKYIVFIIFALLGLEMINNVIKNKRSLIVLNNFGLLLFGFAVSIDSFSAGIGVEFISNKHLLSCITFSIMSFIFTFLGLKLGGKINNRFSDLAPLMGGVILIFLAVFFVFS